jgi:hypothetical protein
MTFKVDAEAQCDAPIGGIALSSFELRQVSHFLREFVNSLPEWVTTINFMSNHKYVEF